MIPRLVAHRGYMEHYPENSMLGLEMALKTGACMIELDVQMNADHDLVVLHDSDFQRTAGIEQSIFDVRTAELIQISVHEPERFGDKFLQTPVPMLKQVMEMIARYPKATVFVEIKDESFEQWGLDCVMDALLGELQSYASQSVVISYNLDALECVKQRKLYLTGWVLHSFDQSSLQTAKRLKPDYLICNHEKITEGNIPWLGSWMWMLYDITDPDLALQWSKRGVALIETRDVGVMLKNPELMKESCKHGS